MTEWTIEPYTGNFKNEWNSFISSARNSTFLFNRQYMDYHSDRFDDCSMIARKRGKLMAILPANLSGDTLHSHQGLTYGGWVLPRRHVDTVDCMVLWQTWLDECVKQGIKAIDYKPLPYIYCTMPSEEDYYLLSRFGGIQTECNISATIRLNDNPGFDDSKRQQMRKASRLGANIRHISDPKGYAEFYEMLSACLSSRHDAKPVHSLDEITMLSERFPDNIQLWGIFNNGKMQAGVWLFISDKVVHSQYTASTEEGRKQYLLTLLYKELISMAESGKFGTRTEYFDFGTSNEDHGQILNEGLYRQKSALGGSGVAYRRFKIEL